MLDELSPRLSPGKLRDLLRRLESKRVAQALPAEVELAMLWGLSKLGPIEVEPAWPDGRPEAISHDLFAGTPTVVEVAALSDASLPGDEGMRNAAEKLRQLAGSIRRGSGRHLSFFFAEETIYQPRYARRIKVPRSLTLTQDQRRQMAAWLNDDTPTGALRLATDELDVTLSWHKERQHRFSYHSTMPPEVHHLRDNHLHGLLERKARQVRNSNFHGLRCLLLGDAGSTLLRRFRNRDPLRRFVCGSEIVQAFLSQPGCVLDVVVVFAPNRRTSPLMVRESLAWDVSMVCRAGLEVTTAGVEALARHFPAPRFEGYQARHLQEQGAYAAGSRGWHLGMQWTSEGESMTARISARALLELLAGRGRLEDVIGPPRHANIFDIQLQKGRTIRSIGIEPAGIDEDDDHVAIEFETDPAAAPLSVEKSAQAPHD